MTLKTWFKGLGVFVVSSLITAAATMTLDPAGFNFSKAGLIKVGVAALVIGVKAVLLYLKQSPLPGNQAGFTNWTRISSGMVLCVAIPVSVMLAGCGNAWEQATYSTLAANRHDSFIWRSRLKKLRDDLIAKISRLKFVLK